MSTSLAKLAATLVGGEDWQRGTGFLAWAEAERVAPLLYYCLDRTGWPDAISETDGAALRRSYYRTAGKNVALLSALTEVTAALRERGIGSVPFKGAVLAQSLYPNAAIRPMGDIDILVMPEEGARAESVLIDNGYRPWAPDMTRGLSRRTRHARLFIGGPGDTINVDLHWSLVGHCRDVRAPQREWLTRETASGQLTDTAHLLYLAAHLKLQHYDEEIPLLWLIDFYRLATIGTVDWDMLIEDAAKLGWADALAASARDTEDRLGVRLPERLHGIASTFEPRVGVHRDGARNDPKRVWNELATASWRARLALARAYVLPSPSYVRYRYRPTPTWSWPLCYAKRWFAILARGAGLLRGAVGGKPSARPLLAPRESC